MTPEAAYMFLLRSWQHDESPNFVAGRIGVETSVITEFYSCQNHTTPQSVQKAQQIAIQVTR